MPKRGRLITFSLPAWTTQFTSGIFDLDDVGALKAANTYPRGPVAPTGLGATAGNNELGLAWTAPTTTYGTITNYLVEYTASGGAPQYVLTGSTGTSYTLTGLTNAVSYTIRVAAVNHTAGDFSDSVSQTPQPTVSVEYLVIAGGGGGGGDWNSVSSGGGGGAGGYRTATEVLSVTGTTYTVTVGGGGAGTCGGFNGAASGGVGSNSVFRSITSAGGGGGGAIVTSNGFGQVGLSGGSGGGGGGRGGAGGSGNTPSTIPPQGNNGGASGVGGSNNPGAGGGIGSAASGTTPGAGLASTITGTSVTRGVGGSIFSGAAGTAYTGNGGGSAVPGDTYDSQCGGNGGAGVVIIRASAPASATTGSPVVTTVGSDTVYQFNATGSITF